MRRFRTFSFISLSLAVAAGCTIVNSYDEVKPRREVGYGSNPKVEEPLADAGGTTDPGDAQAEDVVDSGPTTDHELLVVAGQVEQDGGAREAVLAVLDPITGHELGAREPMHVAGVAHEAARDLWYVFEAPSSFVTSPADVVKLHIRTLDAKTGAWTELSNTIVPTLFFYESIAVTNQRITFVAHPAEAGSPSRLVTLDTSNPAAPQQLDSRDVSPTPSGMVAVPSGAGAGGQLALVNVGTAAAGECEAGLCNAKVKSFLIPNSGGVSELGTGLYGGMVSFGTVSYGTVVCGGGPDVLLMLPKSGAGPHTLHLLDYSQTPPAPRSTVDFTMNPNSTLLRRSAVDNKRRVAFVVEANTDTNLHAIPLNGTKVAKVSLGHSGQSVYFDPASDTVFAPFNQGGGHTFSAYKVSVTAANEIQLTARVAPEWDPPANLRPLVLGIRNPKAYACQ